MPALMGSDGSAQRPDSPTTSRARGRSRCHPHDHDDPSRCCGAEDPVEAHDQELDGLDELAERTEQQRQLVVDQEIYDELALSDFAGPGYELFTKQIASYGLGVMRAWIATGRIFPLCAAEGIRLPDELGGCTEEDVSGLANATVTQALIDFREKGLRGGGWRPEGGRSLRTYFVTGCVYAFPNAYRSWRREQARWRRTVHATLAPEDLNAICDLAAPIDIATDVATRLDGAAFYAGLSRRQREMVFLDAHGYSHAEIAHLMQEKSPKAVEGVLYRIRRAKQSGSTGAEEGSA